MKHRIITISRQFGSGGRTIGKAVAAKLNLPCYDQNLIELFAKESGFSEEYIKNDGEHAAHKNLLSSIFSDRVYDTPYTQDVLWEAQRKVILELAEKESCVIVGRCADFILKDTADAKRIADKDKRRKAYYQKYTNTIWGDADNYHIALDSAALGFDTCINILTDLY